AAGNAIRKRAARRAKTGAELRAAAVCVDGVLLVHDGTRTGSDLFSAVLTMLDPQVVLGVAHVPAPESTPALLQTDHERALALGREVAIHPLAPDAESELVELVRDAQYDLVILPENGRSEYVRRNAHCAVFVASPPSMPD